MDSKKGIAMNDKEFMQEYVKAAKLIFSSLSQDLVSIKDADLKFLTMTHKMLDFMGVKSADEVIGKTLKDFQQSCGEEIIEKFTKQDLEVVATKKNKIYLEIAPVYNREAKIYKVYKTPIINPDTNNCLGVRVQISNMYWPNVIKSLFRIHGTKGLLLGHSNKADSWRDYPLNEMQHTVLFLCLNNYSYSEIALLMNSFGQDVTPVRVNDYLEQLKLIFHVRTKAQLIEKALGLNFHTYLPIGLFDKLASIDISNEVATIISPN